MRKLLLFNLLFIHYLSISQTSIGNIYPNTHAQLDVSAERKGVLIPRITLIDVMRTDPFDDTVTTIPTSLLVYNTGTNPGVVAGYYYWANDRWNKLITQADGITGGTPGKDGGKGDKGDKGDPGTNGAKGDKGDTGATGPAGAKGATGATGPAGAKGDKGDTGPAGAKGDTGPAGAKGATGATGPAGAKGATGATGPAGAKGDKGDTGPAGAKGDKGDTGATGPAGAKGATGATGPAGAKGDKGDTGATGPAGAPSLEPWNVAGTSTKASDNTQDIYQKGKVGIGVANMTPGALLDVKGGDALINDLTVGKGTGTANANNTAVGNKALASNTSGHENTATGFQALNKNNIGMFNTAAGYQALYNNSSGSINTATGLWALLSNTTGGDNTADGAYALSNTTTGKNNTAIGSKALLNNITGNNNVAIGFEAGPQFYDTHYNLENTIAIGSGAKVMVSNIIRLGNAAITRIEGQVAFSASSDRRWKENIKTIPLGLDFINKVRPVEYHRINSDDKTKEWGVIAQELQQTIEEAGYHDAGVVQGDHTPDNYLSVRYTDLIAPLIKAVQELSLQNEELKKKNDQMKRDLIKVGQLENQINEMEKRIKQLMTKLK